MEFFFPLTAHRSYMEAGCWWLMPVILATQEAEFKATLGKTVLKTLSLKNPSHTHKRRAGEVAQDVGPEFKPQYHQKKKKKKRDLHGLQREQFSVILKYTFHSFQVEVINKENHTSVGLERTHLPSGSHPALGLYSWGKIQ
jgi:hypothetical protein